MDQEPWVDFWMQTRNDLDITDLKKYPLMPAPLENGAPSVRPVTTSEAGDWINMLVQTHCKQSESVKYTSHSLKATLLSYCAKRGITFEDRLALGYHAGPLKMALTYSRDGASRPLIVLIKLLKEIRDKIFQPDVTRSGRLNEASMSAKVFENRDLPLQVPVVVIDEEKDIVKDEADVHSDDHERHAQSRQVMMIVLRCLPQMFLDPTLIFLKGRSCGNI